MEQTKLTVFNNEEFGEIRTVIIGENYFVGKDAAEALGKCKKCSPEPCQR